MVKKRVSPADRKVHRKLKDQKKRRAILERKRKKVARKRAAKAPSWVAAVQSKALRAAAEEGIEVQQETLDPAVQERLNAMQPLDTQLFLTGLPQDATDASVKQFFKQFGDVRRVLVVRNKVTSQPSGSAFIHFCTPSSVDSAFAFAQQNARELNASTTEQTNILGEGLSKHQAKKLKFKSNPAAQMKHDPFVELLQSRVGVRRVLSRDGAHEFIASMVKKKKNTKVAADDPRNLYLLQEGLVLDGMPAARGLPPQYLRMLLQDYEARKAQVRNVNMFVSTTRLCFRNIPANTTAAELRKICAKEARKYYKWNPDEMAIDKATWSRHGPVKSVKIPIAANGSPRGYGFVQFATHNVALHVLRALNNNPNIFGPSKRLVVSFAIEDSNALQRHQRRMELRDVRRKRPRESEEEEAAADGEGTRQNELGQ